MTTSCSIEKIQLVISFASARPGLTASLSSERFKLDIDSYLEAIRYSKENDLNTENYRTQMIGNYRMTERTDLFFEFSGLKDSTVDNQLEDTGRIVKRRDRKRYRGNGSIAYDLDDLSQLIVDYRYTTTKYESKDEVDRDEHRIRIPYYRWFNDRLDRLVLRPTYVKASLDNDTDVDAYNFSFGWIHIFSETLRMENFIGYGAATEDNGTRKTRNQSGSADFVLIKEGDTLSLRGGFRAYASLNADGELDEVDRFYCRIGKKLTERLEIQFNGGLYYTRPLGKNDKYETAYYELKPSISYRITENHTIGLGYTFQSETDKTISDNRDRSRNLIWISIE